MIDYQNAPYTYRLSSRGLCGVNPSLQILVNASVWKRLQPLPETSPAIHSAFEHLGEVNLNQSFTGQRFGFNNVLLVKADEPNKGEVTVSVPIPVFESLGDKCDLCDGTGELDDHECLYCMGRKQQLLFDHRALYLIACSLQVLLFLLELDFYEWKDKNEMASPPFQPMLVSTMCRPESQEASFSCNFSIPFVAWLASHQHPMPFADVSKLMLAVQQRLTPVTQMYYTKHDFRVGVDFENGWLNGQCPGGGTGFAPEHSGPRPGRGYALHSHNVDTMPQQFVLLSALAMLTDKAWEAGVFSK